MPSSGFAKDGKPKPREMTYIVGWTDLPAARMPVPALNVLDYVSPRALEEWEGNFEEELDRERVRLVTERENERQTSTNIKGNKKKRGRPPAHSNIEAGAVAVPETEEEASRVKLKPGVMSLSTPQKARLADFDGVSEEDAAPSPTRYNDDYASTTADSMNITREMSQDFAADELASVMPSKRPKVSAVEDDSEDSEEDDGMTTPLHTKPGHHRDAKSTDNESPMENNAEDDQKHQAQRRLTRSSNRRAAQKTVAVTSIVEATDSDADEATDTSEEDSEAHDSNYDSMEEDEAEGFSARERQEFQAILEAVQLEKQQLVNMEAHDDGSSEADERLYTPASVTKKMTMKRQASQELTGKQPRRSRIHSLTGTPDTHRGRSQPSSTEKAPTEWTTPKTVTTGVRTIRRLKQTPVPVPALPMTFEPKSIPKRTPVPIPSFASLSSVGTLPPISIPQHLGLGHQNPDSAQSVISPRAMRPSLGHRPLSTPAKPDPSPASSSRSNPRQVQSRLSTSPLTLWKEQHWPQPKLPTEQASIQGAREESKVAITTTKTESTPMPAKHTLGDSQSTARKRRRSARSPSVDSEGNPVWEVKHILDDLEETDEDGHVINRWFQVYWKGDWPDNPTWEPEENINDQALIRNYWKCDKKRLQDLRRRYQSNKKARTGDETTSRKRQTGLVSKGRRQSRSMTSRSEENSSSAESRRDVTESAPAAEAMDISEPSDADVFVEAESELISEPKLEPAEEKQLGTGNDPGSEQNTTMGIHEEGTKVGGEDDTIESSLQGGDGETQKKGGFLSGLSWGSWFGRNRVG